MYYFQILFNHPTLGICLCDTFTRCGAWVFTITEEQAQRRVTELQDAGIVAWYEPIKNCWANDENWIG